MVPTDLAVVSPYPRQLQQASALLKYTLTTLGKQPEQILLAGDSAGGHLALALLSHILHPHPTVHPIKLDGRFSSVALLSPWVTFDTGKTRSMRLNRYKDALAIPTLNAWSSTFIGNAPLDPYLQPLKAPENWFQGLPVQRVLVLAGGDEIFVDDIREFGESLRHTFPPTIVEIVKDEAHDHLILAFLMGEQSSKQQTIFQDWILQSVDQ
ncbi:hypothetical protein VI817_009533 [Penicillium citrinum]|nr:hypothetical protein VI817_009533 [Penicillium citrinum]